MSNKIENIVIVGGGTAGWLSAMYLSRVLKADLGSGCNITLIESSDISTIGVGEATIISIKRTFQFLGIDENEWMAKCNATFKIAIKFVNWSVLTANKNNYYWHPFGGLPSLKGFEQYNHSLQISHQWLKRRLLGSPERLDYSCYSCVYLCDAKKSPRFGNEAPYKGATEYAYHLNAGLLATYLKGKAKERGVKHIVDNVLDVALDEKGYISHVKTAKNGNLYGDLFIDCSGFQGLLINKALQEPFISFSDSLFCDSAIAMQIPTDDESNGINPYTTATALSSGWVWDIPLFGRSGNGYVYSSAFISREDAEQEFRQHLGEKSNQIEARHIKMRVGRTRNPWVKNCVSIGLSSGFIEPLESTGIWFAEIGLLNLLIHFPNKLFYPKVIEKYNKIMEHYYKEVRDFIVLHYCTTHREDTPFWKENKYHPAIPESLRAKLELWKAVLPHHEDLFNPGLFSDHSYAAILAGMDCLPKDSLPILDYRDDAEAEHDFFAVKTRADSLKKVLPDQYKYLRQLRRGVLV